MYETVPLSKQKYVPFGLGKLPDYAVHPDAASILCKLDLAAEDLNLSIAYGYASGSRQDNDIDKVHQTADDRMYEKKKQMKAAVQMAV